MNLIPIFSNFIVHEKISINHSVVEKFCYTKLNGSTGVDLSLNEPELKELYFYIDNKFNQLHNVLGLTSETSQVIKEAWVNLNNRKEITSPHSHPRRFFVAVYYPKATDGDLRLFNPNSVLEHVIPCDQHVNVVEKYNQYNSATWNIPVRTGDLILFPAWLKHSVENHGSESDRISIAFNSSLNISMV